VNTVNRNWGQTDPVFLVTYVLWRINYIHPFITGTGVPLVQRPITFSVQRLEAGCREKSFFADCSAGIETSMSKPSEPQTTLIWPATWISQHCIN